MIIYFTGTGNSRYAAEYIGLLTGDTVISANSYIKDCKKGDFYSESPYVFVGPTYAWRFPRIFSDFIGSSELRGSKKAYFVMTCGDGIGNADFFLKKLCKSRGMEYMGVARIVMPENYIVLFKAPDKRLSGLQIARSEKRLDELIPEIRNEKKFKKVKSGLNGGFLSRVVNPVFYATIVRAGGFRVSDKCTGCEKCKTLCPLNNIVMEKGKPVWGRDCTHCMACICACPAEAIEYRRATVGKHRYYNDKKPEIKGQF